jgi:dynein heavy chain, axonemal
MQLDLESKYHAVFVHYTRKDLEGVRKLYQKFKDAPAIPRNTPPVAGSIAWARQLYRRIETPMKQFKQYTHVLDSPESKKHIRNYNKLARALTEFELIWHRTWYSIVDSSKSGLQATLLVSSSDNHVYVNFDSQITQLIKETKHMQRLGLDIPQSAKGVCQKEIYYKGLCHTLQQILNQKKSILARVTNSMVKAMAPHVDELDRNLQPGLTALTWTSLNLEHYLGANQRQLFKLSELVDRLLDISECRIGAGVRKVAEMSLIEIPADNEQWTVDSFLEKTEKRCSTTLQVITNRSNLVEAAARDMIAELSKGVSQFVTPELRISYEAVYYNANYQNFEALVQTTKGSLDFLRARLGTYTQSQYMKPPSQRAFFKAELLLLIPNVIMQPKLEDIQVALNKASLMIVEVSKKLSLSWKVFLDQADDQPTGHTPEDTSQVANNKDVMKVISLLGATVNSMKKDVESHREQFSKYDFLWRDDKTETIEKFLNNSPTIGDFENEINRYEYIEREIMEIPGTTQIGLLLISAEPLKLALLSETKDWKQQYGLNLNRKVKKDMEQLIEYMDSKTIKLSRKIVDIDDLRIAVETLSEIRETEVDIDMKVAPIEEAYLLLTKHNVNVTREETEMVDSLRYSWKKLKMLVIDTQMHLSKIQPIFKNELIGSVQKFALEVQDFSKEYEENGYIHLTLALWLQTFLQRQQVND